MNRASNLKPQRAWRKGNSAGYVKIIIFTLAGVCLKQWRRVRQAQYCSVAAFTLIELLVCILIMGVLMALAMPGVGMALDRVHRLEDQNKMQQIYAAYVSLETTSPGYLAQMGLRRMSDLVSWMAKEGDLQDLSVWSCSQARSPNPVNGSMSSGTKIADQRIHYEMALGLPLGAPQRTTPLFWTRGLQEDGTWGSDSPYQGKGGFVCFLDGRITWYPDFKKKPLHSYENPLQYAQKIQDALPPGIQLLK